MLEIKDLKIAYPTELSSPSWAIDGVSFSIGKGETLGLVGESGCGKSTIGKAILRLLPNRTHMEGEITFEGRSLLSLSSKQLEKFRGEAVGLVFQDPMTRLDPLMSIGDHCVETLQAHRENLTYRQAKSQACTVLEKVKIPANRWSQYAHEFSGGMRQRVAIALALLLNPKLIIADEPTTSLDVTVSAEILRELKRLCSEEQMGLLLISHDLALVGEYCDQLAVMKGGKIVESGAVKTVFNAPQHPYTRSLLSAALHLQLREEKSTAILGKETVLKVDNLKQYYTLEGNFLDSFFKKEKKFIKAVDEVNFELYRGEIFGLVGESGCGKSTLSRTLLKLIKPTGGKVEFLGEDLTNLSGEKMRQKRRLMQMIFQDPLACLNPLMTVGESIADPLLIHQKVSLETAKKQVLEMLDRVGLTPVEEFYRRYPRELSGGQQQRVAIARALITRPELVICDEPVSMLDASVQTQVLELMLELQKLFNLTYLFITHDLWLARFLCDRIAVMTAGKIVEMGDTEQIFSHPQHPYTQKLIAAAPRIYPDSN
ncbi:MAG: ABC transporter ATP-binding protein [Microcystis panniformis Mp_MB_F_20051200_S9]|uniref:ABC transporter ATP-binding protein n=1 Tax=Microcystis panniformis Mp_MB_F_20051200_S9 TaxID=2486223 RepID=A0A552PSE2_9CHRO|nr:MAG: ABC transporter ATP-binding protein [Microcystis panniformis Mp_MB_F_20080800_S26D]TRV48332.1 MAG: ABC transporter ATP-binding protein [Microcystis panniformis Mp_GB_SS_20050300_S99D]TRV50593.1 MAG: ABC transporter ATP-binding protein [Microcystis panniformis Mp_GB_SS_20050300_S99]TRV55846.1 MAG: ABC transporter ATP-binding protein [Microcystis panniformis Mp_MB_F_20080800_S26]TRV59664.1 MAG: ABC transporter ATP-binding protein [Microcystis panniformis Mp_MB_F_20051200_S9D]TRV59919.1 M